MSKKLLYIFTIISIFSLQSVFAFQLKETTQYFNGPTITSIGSTSATLSLSPSVLTDMTDEEKSGIYFEYAKSQQMCIAIYPTPEYCLPKKTEVGKAATIITNLEPNTSYTVMYKRDNTIRCITTPCPTNDFQSLSLEFRTTAVSGGDVPTPPINSTLITRNLSIGSRGTQVITLQNILIQQGYLYVPATGYFGILTFQAVKNFQSAHGIISIGLVGPRTREALNTISITPPPTFAAEVFEGVVTAYSTQCFVDGECSITVDGKKIVTTIGRLQLPVGRVTGLANFGEIENNLGARARVYAKKTSTGYTLYGNENYYVNIIPFPQRKLPAESQ